MHYPILIILGTFGFGVLFPEWILSVGNKDARLPAAHNFYCGLSFCTIAAYFVL